MKTVPRMSSQQEDTLLRALDITVDSLSTLAPTDAIVKAATVCELPRGHISLLVQAFNAGQALEKQASDDYADRAATYAVVDPDAVTARLFPVYTKAAAVTVVDYSDYEFSPEVLRNPAANTLAQRAKEASFRPWTKTPTTTVEGDCRQAQIVSDYEERFCSELDLTVQQLEKRAAVAMETLTDYFGPYGYVPGKIPAVAAQENAKLLWGDLGETIVKIAAPNQAPSHIRHIHRVDPAQTPYREITLLLEVLPELQQKQADYAVAVAAHQQRIDNNSWLFTKWARSPGWEEKQASPDPYSLAKILGVSLAKDTVQGMSGFGSSTDPGAVAGGLEKLTSPDHETELRNIQARAMLQDLFSNDPVLRQHDPQAVADAYNSMSAMAPEAMQHPELARGFLRKRMEAGAMEPFEFQGLTQLNSSLMPPAPPKPPAPVAA